MVSICCNVDHQESCIVNGVSLGEGGAYAAGSEERVLHSCSHVLMLFSLSSFMPCFLIYSFRFFHTCFLSFLSSVLPVAMKEEKVMFTSQQHDYYPLLFSYNLFLNMRLNKFLEKRSVGPVLKALEN